MNEKREEWEIVEEIVRKRIDKVVEDANKEFGKKWVISIGSCCGNEIDIYMQQYYKPLTEYTKEELLEMIKESLLITHDGINTYQKIGMLIDNGRPNLDIPGSIPTGNFKDVLWNARIYLKDAASPFAPIVHKLFNIDKEWTEKYNHISEKTPELKEFLVLKRYYTGEECE